MLPSSSQVKQDFLKIFWWAEPEMNDIIVLDLKWRRTDGRRPPPQVNTPSAALTLLSLQFLSVTDGSPGSNPTLSPLSFPLHGGCNCPLLFLAETVSVMNNQ